MSKIKIVRNVAFVESAYSLADIELLAKYAPDAMSLFKDKEKVFCAKIGSGDGSISPYGVVYGSQANKNAPAAVMIRIPDGTTDAAKFVREEVGTALLKMRETEAQYEAALAKVKSDLGEIEASIEYDAPAAPAANA